MSFDPVLATTATPVAGLIATSFGAEDAGTEPTGDSGCGGRSVSRLHREIGDREFCGVRSAFYGHGIQGRAQ